MNPFWRTAGSQRVAVTSTPQQVDANEIKPSFAASNGRIITSPRHYSIYLVKASRKDVALNIYIFFHEEINVRLQRCCKYLPSLLPFQI